MRRSLSTKMRVQIFTAAGGRCDICGGKIEPGQRWEVSHRTPIAMGGSDTPDNMFPAHERCHREFTRAVDVPAIAKAKRREAVHLGAKRTSRPIPGSRASGLRKRMNGTVEKRS